MILTDKSMACHAASAAGRFAAEREHRRFRTVWDAVAWLKAHHPAIDLDAPYRPRR